MPGACALPRTPTLLCARDASNGAYVGADGQLYHEVALPPQVFSMNDPTGSASGSMSDEAPSSWLSMQGDYTATETAYSDQDDASTATWGTAQTIKNRSY